MIVRKSLGSGISGAVRYVLGEGKRDPETGKVPELAPGETSRVAWYGGTGFGFPIDTDERLDIARKVMEWSALTQASKTKRCKDDCLHVMLAWDKDEHPDRAEMEAAAQSLLARLGMENARAIWAAHDDTDHAHLHLVVSRINPETGKAYKDAFDTPAMSDWALAWEKEHGGVRCSARTTKERTRGERNPEDAINTLAQSRETFSERDLHRALTPAIPARDTRKKYIAEVVARHDIVALADPETGKVVRYTTRQALAAEHIAETLGDSREADHSHAVSGSTRNAVLEDREREGKSLREDQTRAFLHATGKEGLAVISGKAGTGKSFTLVAIQEAYEAEGYDVKTLAPTNKVASALRKDGLDAGTLHGMLGQLDRGKAEWNRETVIMVDEAGMVSTRLMARLLSHAEKAGAKVILVGDEKQLASLDRGGMFGHFAQRHGAAELSQITRQNSAEQRELAVRASHYDFKGVLTSLKEQGGLEVVATEGERISRAADLWRAKTAEKPGRSLFVVAVSNDDVDAANQAIRQVRRERGELGEDRELSTRDGAQPFAVGDRVMFTGSAQKRKDREAGLANGNTGTVTAIEGGKMTVSIDGAKPVTFTVGKDREAREFDAVRHGYAGTIFKAQGATYDEAIMLDSGAMRASTAYVALTRHRQHVTVVTTEELSRPHVTPWMQESGGYEGLGEAQRISARKSYEAWRTEGNPKAAKHIGLEAYITFVQAQEAQRQEASGGADMQAIARRWQRADDRRAASRFETLNYRPADLDQLTPDAVRAAVGVETFEKGEPLPDPITRRRTEEAARAEQGIVAAEEKRLDGLYGKEEPESPNKTETESGSSGSSNPWGWRMPPRPKTPAEERALLAATVAPFVTASAAGETEQYGTGLTFWQRVGQEAAELWQDMRDFARERWQDLVAKEPQQREHDGPDIER